jgi:hypothetical protein
VVANAILDQFEDDYQRDNEATYSLDSIWAAADRVVAALATHLLGVKVEARHHPTIIGPAVFVIAEDQNVL